MQKETNHRTSAPEHNQSMHTWQDSMHDTHDKPKWLKILFQLFVVNYRNAWTDCLANEQLEKANDFLWINALEPYSEAVIMDAGMQAMKHYAYPPSIQQFLEIAVAVNRNKRLDENTTRILDDQNRYHNPVPPSSLSAEYMANNSPSGDDPYKLLFAKHKGRALGEKVISQIKTDLAKKMVRQ